jgi:hypothetical protein
MGQISSKLRAGTGNHLTYWCQGCKMAHSIHHGADGWSWNGNVDRPTFEPSVLVTGGHYAAGFKQGDRCWCTWNAEHPNDPSSFTCQRCHTFIRDGMVQFLGDCSHELAGQTLPLPDLPEHLQG